MRIRLIGCLVGILALEGLAAAAHADSYDSYERRMQDTRFIRIPRGHLPPPGSCRLWHFGRPAGHQPPPASCHVLRHRLSGDAFILDSRGKIVRPY